MKENNLIEAQLNKKVAWNFQCAVARGDTVCIYIYMNSIYEIS